MVDVYKFVSNVAIAIVKHLRSNITEKKSIVFSIAVTMSVELLLIMILMGPGKYMYVAHKEDSEGETI